MFWLIAPVCSIIGALLLHYKLTSKILHTKQAISIKNSALRDVHEELQRLDKQEIDLQRQQTSMQSNIFRLRTDIKDLLNSAKEKGLPIPEASFPLEELYELEETSEKEGS